MSNGGPKAKWITAERIDAARQIMALVRDASILLLALFFLLLPRTFNRILTDAGFDRGSFMGMEWRNQLQQSNAALADADQAISDVQVRTASMATSLKKLEENATDPEQKQKITALAKENTKLAETTTNMQATVAQALQANAPLVAQLDVVPPDANRPSDYLVGLQTLGLTDAERQALNAKLRERGYRLHNLSVSYQTTDRPSWFAPRSTVLYYSASAAAAANSLARVLKELTGEDFVVQRGSGRGVDPGQQATTLFAHYVRG